MADTGPTFDAHVVNYADDFVICCQSWQRVGGDGADGVLRCRSFSVHSLVLDGAVLAATVRVVKMSPADGHRTAHGPA